MSLFEPMRRQVFTTKPGIPSTLGASRTTKMINDLPIELLHKILEQAALLNELCGVEFTYGLSRTPLDANAKVYKYVNGMIAAARLPQLTDCCRKLTNGISRMSSGGTQRPQLVKCVRRGINGRLSIP